MVLGYTGTRERGCAIVSRSVGRSVGRSVRGGHHVDDRGVDVSVPAVQPDGKKRPSGAINVSYDLLLGL